MALSKITEYRGFRITDRGYNAFQVDLISEEAARRWNDRFQPKVTGLHSIGEFAGPVKTIEKQIDDFWKTD